MNIGIVGLPNSGKTTVFNALTGSAIPTEPFSSGQLEIHTAVVNVPDERVDRLAEMFKPHRVTYAQVTYNDIAGLARGVSSGISGPLLNAIAVNDALLLVVRAFENKSVPHPEDSIDPARDIAIMESEFLLNDMAIIENRLHRLLSQKTRGTAQEREHMVREEALLRRLLAVLEEETPLRELGISEDERKMLGGFGFLSMKPLLRVINVGGDEGESRYADLGGPDTLFLRARLEAELAQMEPEEAVEFLSAYGIQEPGMKRAIRHCYGMLGVISFFTVVEDEVRAWPLARGGTAPEAAGVVHSDMQRGFIRAETIAFSDLMATGSMAEARRQGRLRLEGREYVVQDGDVLTIRFNV